MTRLNQQIAQNNRLAAEADQATRIRLRGSNQRIRAEQGLLRVQQQRQSLALANLRQEARELQNATRSTSRFSSVTRELGANLGALGISFLTTELVRFSREVINASVQIDSYRRALSALTGSSVVAGQRLRELQDLADLPGLRFRQAVDGAVALEAIGVEAETTTRILRELSNAAAFTGTGGEFERGLLGFRQLIQRGRLSQEELNQLTENIGLASRVIRDEFGTVLAEDIQEQLEDSGRSIEDFVEIVLTGFERLERFPLDAPSAKLNRLSNSFFEFQAAIGDRFLNVLGEGAEGLTNFFDRFTDFINNTDAATRAVENYVSRIEGAGDAGDLNTAISNRITFLEGEQAALEEASRGLSTYFRQRGRETAAGREYREITEELERLRSVQGDVAAQTNFFTSEQARLATQAQTLRTEINRLNEELQGSTPRRDPGGFARRRDAVAELSAVQAQINTVANALRALATVNTRAGQSTETTTEVVRNLSLELAQASAAARRYQTAFEGARNVGDSSAALQNTIDALNREQAAEEAYARESIEDKQRLETELFNIEDTYNRARADARTQHDARIQAAAERTAETRITAAQRARDVELAAFDAAAESGQRYADALRSISDIGNRLEFQRLVDRLQDQGLSFDAALTQAQRYISVITAVSSTVTAADRAYGRFNATLGDDTSNRFSRLFSGARQITDLFEEQQARLEQAEFRSQQNEDRAFAARPGSDVLGDLQRDARAQGAAFLFRQRRQQIQELERSVATVERTVDGALARIGGRLADTFVNVITDGTASLRDFGREFLAFSVRILARTAIEIAQQKALQAEIARTNALRTAGLVSSVASPTSALSLLSFLIPAGGALFHNPISDRIAQRGGQQAARFLQADRETQVRNSQDFVDNFVPSFFRDFANLGLQAGQAAATSTPSQPVQITIPVQVGGRTLEELVVELDDMEQSGRVVRRRKNSSLIGR